MSNSLTYLTIALFLLLLGCDEGYEYDNLLVGKTTELEVGRKVSNARHGLSLQVQSVTDSRCAIGLVCVWEGYAAVRFNLITKKREYDFTLDTHRLSPFRNDTIIEGLKFELVDVLPYPVADEDQPSKIVKILVDKY